MRTDFDKQWERRKAWRATCPLDDDLRRRVLQAQQETKGLPTFHFSLSTFRWLPAAVAAACLLAVLLPLSLREPSLPNDVVRVNVGDASFLFVCNCDCPPYDAVIQIRKMIK